MEKKHVLINWSFTDHHTRAFNNHYEKIRIMADDTATIVVPYYMVRIEIEEGIDKPVALIERMGDTVHRVTIKTSNAKSLNDLNIGA